MNNNSILKEKMNKRAKIIIGLLSLLLVGSVALNVSLLFQNNPETEKIEARTEHSENGNDEETIPENEAVKDSSSVANTHE